MNKTLFLIIIVWTILLPASAQIRNAPLTREDIQRAASNYARYCALCHGADREGNAADFAPSLRSQSLMSTIPLNFLASSVAFGRPDTPMAAYLNEMGGPLNMRDIFTLAIWLKFESKTETIALPEDPVAGDPYSGARLYARECAECHGQKGDGVTAPALGNPAFLAFATDAYIRYAIEKGRDGTEMQAFGHVLSSEQLDDLTTYIRSLASGWSPEPKELAPYPGPEDYVLHPKGKSPDFRLRENRYVPMEQVKQALEKGNRMVLLDTRTSSEWHNAHIPGAVPMPYYISEEEVDKGLPKDGTWIVAYCSCPHAASDKIIDMLRKKGYKRTAVIDEGFFKWIHAGYPVTGGKIEGTAPD